MPEEEEEYAEEAWSLACSVCLLPDRHGGSYYCLGLGNCCEAFDVYEPAALGLCQEEEEELEMEKVEVERPRFFRGCLA